MIFIVKRQSVISPRDRVALGYTKSKSHTLDTQGGNL